MTPLIANKALLGLQGHDALPLATRRPIGRLGCHGILLIDRLLDLAHSGSPDLDSRTSGMRIAVVLVLSREDVRALLDLDGLIDALGLAMVDLSAVGRRCPIGSGHSFQSARVA